jgi:hypothetical protein
MAPSLRFRKLDLCGPGIVGFFTPNGEEFVAAKEDHLCPNISLFQKSLRHRDSALRINRADRSIGKQGQIPVEIVFQYKVGRQILRRGIDRIEVIHWKNK